MTTNENEVKVDAHACPHGCAADEWCPDCAPPAPPEEDVHARAFDVAAWDAEMFWG
jgi:hypothetical protein